MARTRITKADVWDQYSILARILNEDMHLGYDGDTFPALYLGDKVNGVTNKLIIDKRQVWPDGMAGYTTREAYNALRVMISAFGMVADRQDDMRRTRARSGL